jgi:cold shock CspA family protein
MRHRRIEEFKVSQQDTHLSQPPLQLPTPQTQTVARENPQSPEMPRKLPPIHFSPVSTANVTTPFPMSESHTEDNSLSNPKPKYQETQSEKEYTGTLKFFDEKNGFGFMTVRDQETAYDVFVYRKEFKKAKVSIEVIRQIKTGAVLTFGFHIATYTGKSSECKKAVSLQLLETALPPELM